MRYIKNLHEDAREFGYGHAFEKLTDTAMKITVYTFTWVVILAFAAGVVIGVVVGVQAILHKVLNIG